MLKTRMVGCTKNQILLSNKCYISLTLKVLMWTVGLFLLHVLPRKDKNAKQAIVMRFMSRKAKMYLLRQTIKLRGSAVYINEHLTKKNSEIARQARAIRKQGKIQSA